MYNFNEVSCFPRRGQFSTRRAMPDQLASKWTVFWITLPTLMLVISQPPLRALSYPFSTISMSLRKLIQLSRDTMPWTWLLESQLRLSEMKKLTPAEGEVPSARFKAIKTRRAVAVMHQPSQLLWILPDSLMWTLAIPKTRLSTGTLDNRACPRTYTSPTCQSNPT